MKVTILGLSLTSSWGNGHATNYRGLTRALARRDDEVTFLERDVTWYAENRDLPSPGWCRTILYTSLSELRMRHARAVREADLVIIGSFVPEGDDVAAWVLGQARAPVAFYDIDTPVTLGKLRSGDTQYLSPELVSWFDLYLSFTGGPVLDLLADEFGARRPVQFYCFVDPEAYEPVELPERWLLTYLGTFSSGRQPALDELLVAPAREIAAQRFAVAGPMYPADIRWPANVERIEHVAPRDHARFYRSGAFTLNITRPEMRAVGYAPSVRLFEAAACGAPIISDRWPGIETVFEPGAEIFLADGREDVLRILRGTHPGARRAVAEAARRRVLAEHTAAARAEQLHALAFELTGPVAG